ncbi:MAG TPA: CBS domain-containing protein [Saprospiraceae bacterium]|nr:CBS domain-containing protein [Saprospiraceae bacterium]MCB9328849.1 CBS domain-containing protein [Lewinellaceae bacterium]HPK08893.1 CBS domain-containing protein [Saprospiraceae bacterium]HPQ20333.1 CBS domain-containing protein [Saprospiraceae bacterium]HRX28461.1 CBS domain-containing protein [Saprospiraceae bacterium]
MIAKSLISEIYIPLKTSDTGEQALTVMNLYHVRHLPIVNDNQLLGIISEEDILDFDLNEAIGSYSLTLFRAFCNEDDHIFEVMSKMAKYNVTVIPVVDHKENYIGLIDQETLIHRFAKDYSFDHTGSIIVIKTSQHNYSLSEISRIIESEGATILAIFTSQESSNDDNLYINIKINFIDSNHIIATLQRFGYVIEGSFTEEDHDEDALKDRYDSLMRYLNV